MLSVNEMFSKENLENFRVYDIEVFKEFQSVTFCKLDGSIDYIFVSDERGLEEYNEHIVEGFEMLHYYIADKILVGFNNWHYDDYILEYIHNPKLVYGASQNIINGQRLNRCYSGVTFDAMLDLPLGVGLKQIEFNQGKNILESSVPFDIDRKLTPDEQLEVIKYNIYDVQSTCEVFKMRIQDIKAHYSLVCMVGDKKLQKRASTYLIGKLLKNNSKKLDSAYYKLERLCIEEGIPFSVPRVVKEEWKVGSGKSVTITEGDYEYVFGKGGLHGTNKKNVYFSNVELADVTSMYPSIIIYLESLGNKAEYYKNIYNTRVELKHKGKKEEQAPLKLILNKTYGILNYKYSLINNPEMAFLVCYYGQNALYELGKRLESVGCKLVQSNTDGVAYTRNGVSDEVIAEVKKDWEIDFNLGLETDYYKQFCQIDVNNYIALEEDGGVKAKGKLKKYSRPDTLGNNQTRIVDLMLGEYLLNGTPFIQTAMKHKDDLSLFQILVKRTSKFDGLDVGGEFVEQKINRAFAVRNKDCKVRKIKGEAYNVAIKYDPDVEIINESIIGKSPKDFNIELDLAYYVRVCKNLIKGEIDND